MDLRSFSILLKDFLPYDKIFIKIIANLLKRVSIVLRAIFYFFIKKKKFLKNEKKLRQILSNVAN